MRGGGIWLYLLTVNPRGRRRQVTSLSHCLLPRRRRSQHGRRWVVPPPPGGVLSLHSTVDGDSSFDVIDSSSSSSPAAMLSAERLREAFQERQTDGVRDLVAAVLWQQQKSSDEKTDDTDDDASLGVDAQTLLEAARQVDLSGQHRGTTMRVMNSCIAAACLAGNPRGANLAQELWQAIEQSPDQLKPDMLTYALTYSAVEPYNDVVATDILHKAIRLAKKMAGSSRRKALATAKRKPVQQAMDCQDKLRTLLGQDFQVLLETDEFLIVFKPSGVVCHHARTTTSGKIGTRNADVSLVDALLHVNVPLSTINPEAQGLVHRLDRGTSGICLLAKTDQMHALLVTEFFLRRVQKTYRTIVSPCPTQRDGTVNVPVDGRVALSNYAVIRSRGTDLALVEMRTFTGRKHQVRIHVAQGLQTPVLLDPLYGGWDDAEIPSDVQETLENISNQQSREQFFLHAASLEIPKYEITITAPEPSFWTDVLDLFPQQSDTTTL